MSDWQTTWAEMKEQFLVRAADRLGRIMKCIDNMAADGGDGSRIGDLKRDMHWLVGVGGTYNLPVLTELGEEAEQICARCEENGVVSSVDAKRLREITEAALSAVQHN